MKLSEWADLMGISIEVAEQRFMAGKIAGAKRGKKGVTVPDNAVKTPMIKLSVWADLMGVTYRTAWTRFKEGRIKGAFKLGGKMILVPRPENVLRLGVLWDRVEIGPNHKIAMANVALGLKMVLDHKHTSLEAVRRLAKMKDIVGDDWTEIEELLNEGGSKK